MNVRCPYCRQIFGAGRRPQCPHCGKTVLMPGFYRSGKRGPATALPSARGAKSSVVRPACLSRPVMLTVGIVLLALVALPVLQRSRGPLALSDDYARDLARENLAVLRLALLRFYRDCGRFPDTDEQLAALLVDPGIAGWDGPYIIELKPDPWRRQFGYAYADGQFVVWSAGPDGTPGSRDDIILRGSAPRENVANQDARTRTR